MNMDINLKPRSMQALECPKLKEVTPKEAKQRSMDMLVAFDSFCQEHNLTYYLAYGTLLGAVRHKGFIPWDDDVDICMPRKDYERLIRLSDTWQIPYDFLCHEKEKTYLFYYGKISDRKTILKNRYMYETRGLGLFIDVFPIDFFYCKRAKTKRISRRIYKETKMLEYTVMLHFWPSRSMVKSFIKYVLYRYARRKGNEYWQHRLREEVRALQIAPISYKQRPYCIHSYTILPEDVFGIGKKMKFEGQYFNCPQNVEKYLETEYGDYLKLPPEEERATDHDHLVYWR